MRNVTIQIGVVTNVEDPEQRGRIKARCPGLVRTDRELPYWIEPCFPYVSSKLAGWFFPPDEGDQVELEVTDSMKSDEMPGESSLVAPNARYRAALYNEAQQLPDDFKTNYPKRRGIRTPAGNILLFDDTEGQEQALLQDKSGNSLLLSTNGVKVLSKDGHYIEWKASGIEMEAAGIKVGAGATEHLVKGETLVNWITSTLIPIFSGHVHPTAAPGPPSPPSPPPLTPPPTSVLSTKHLVE